MREWGGGWLLVGGRGCNKTRIEKKKKICCSICQLQIYPFMWQENVNIICAWHAYLAFDTLVVHTDCMCIPYMSQMSAKNLTE